MNELLELQEESSGIECHVACPSACDSSLVKLPREPKVKIEKISNERENFLFHCNYIILGQIS
jgi:hypothetical protein